LKAISENEDSIAVEDSEGEEREFTDSERVEGAFGVTKQSPIKAGYLLKRGERRRKASEHPIGVRTCMDRH
jgi:hypothetical protein